MQMVGSDVPQEIDPPELGKRYQAWRKTVGSINTDWLSGQKYPKLFDGCFPQLSILSVSDEFFNSGSDCNRFFNVINPPGGFDLRQPERPNLPIRGFQGDSNWLPIQYPLNPQGALLALTGRARMSF